MTRVIADTRDYNNDVQEIANIARSDCSKHHCGGALAV